MKKRIVLATLLSIVFMVLLILNVDWDHFSVIAKRVVIKDLILGFLMLFLANFVRTVRFYNLDHVGNKLGHWWVVNQVYNFMTATLPGGAGEAATAYLLKRFSEFNILSAIRLLLLTRLMDVACLSALLFIAAVRISGTTTPYREAAIWVSGIIFIISLIAVHPKCERFIIGIVQKIPVKGRVMDTVYEKLREITRISMESFGGTTFKITMIQSALVMAGAALSVHFVLQSFGTGFVLTQSLYCFGIYAVFQMVPVQGVAGIGTQAAWWALALKASGYKAPDAIALGIILHGTFYMFIALLLLSAILFVTLSRRFAKHYVE